MEWAEFLNDNQLNSDKDFHGPPDGEYLFKKVVHDVRECLTSYKGCLEIIEAQSYRLPADTLNCLSKWGSITEGWLTEIARLAEQIGKHPTTSPEWAQLIANIGEIVEQAPTFKSEIESLAMPNEEAARQVIQVAVHQTAKLGLLLRDIQAHDYKRLWTIRKYSDLIASN